MPQTYDFGDVEGFESLCRREDGGVQPTTECLLWLMHSCGVPRITAENWEATFIRFQIMQRVSGSTHRGPYGNEAIIVTPEDVYRHIGMRMSADTLRDAAFGKELVTMLMNDARAKLSEFDPGKETTTHG